MNSGKDDPKILYKKERGNSPDYDEFVFIEHPSNQSNDSFTEQTMSKKLASTSVEVVQCR